MDNNKALERFENAHSAQIDKLFWIAGSIESQELAEFLEEDLDDNNWKELFPKLYDSEYFKEYQENCEFKELLIENDKLGFIARISIPFCYNFSYEGEKITGYSSNPGRRRIRYAYADNIEFLITAIEIIADEVFEDYKAIDLIEKSKPTT